jgi:hypothetical protein
MTEHSVESAPVASSTNQGLAASLWEVQKRLDRVMGTPVTLAGYGEGGFPAQYQAMKEPPIVEKNRVLHGIEEGYETGGLNRQVIIPLTDDDVKAWKEKEKMAYQMEFDNWVGNVYHPFDDPAEAEWLQRMYPEYFEARIAENKALHELQQQWARILINGPKSKEDMYLMFRAETDPSVAIRLQGDGKPWKTATEAAQYTAGFFNGPEAKRRAAASSLIGKRTVPTGDGSKIFRTNPERVANFKATVGKKK